VYLEPESLRSRVLYWFGLVILFFDKELVREFCFHLYSEIFSLPSVFRKLQIYDITLFSVCC
jgi:hypothetical protein